jgi:hypothetical protein
LTCSNAASGSKLNLANSGGLNVVALPAISFGDDVRQPSRLETRNTADVLFGVRDGQWREPVSRLRSLTDPGEQRQAKLALPFCTWAGVFTRRSNSALVQHSGQVGIDLDELGEAGAVAVLKAAVGDVYCLAAFRSARAEGVRLIFRIPHCSPENHVAAFDQVALHVQRIYGREPDTSGKDVSRASFVSFDNGLWLNAAALVLPMQLPGETQRFRVNNSLCRTPYAGDLALTCWNWYGRHYASTSPCQDGAAKTHRSLLELGKACALHAHKIKEPVTPRIIDAAFESWLHEHQRQGVTLRCSPDEYRAEFVASIKGCSRKAWFNAAADKWTRWTRHKEFPHDGLPHEKILFAVRQHCAESGSPEFFIGVRDASLVSGGGKDTACRMLKRLCADGHLEKTGTRRQPRHAQTYRLKNMTARNHNNNYHQ